jgi:hypothetical protein
MADACVLYTKGMLWKFASKLNILLKPKFKSWCCNITPKRGSKIHSWGIGQYGEKLVDVLQSQRPVQLIEIGARKLNVNYGKGACFSKSGAVANTFFVDRDVMPSLSRAGARCVSIGLFALFYL